MQHKNQFKKQQNKSIIMKTGKIPSMTSPELTGDYSDLCETCDAERADEIASEHYESGTMEWETARDAILEDFGTCRECFQMDIDERI